MNHVMRHYDRLIDENNDPVKDPEPLREYMNKWDGVQFMKALMVKDQSVLEIGVGTGRLAEKVLSECKDFTGIDISPKTIKRAEENLADFSNKELICSDFMDYHFVKKFDVIYSSLTFMHIQKKQEAIFKIARLLNRSGRFVLSISKDQSVEMEYGDGLKLTLYPDTQAHIKAYLYNADFKTITIFETEFAYLFTAEF